MSLVAVIALFVQMNTGAQAAVQCLPTNPGANVPNVRVQATAVLESVKIERRKSFKTGINTNLIAFANSVKGADR
ncbi:MAG: hypothetical protein K2X81_00450 [Candidatus Obscuribacterales bacterium]|nr:hypothetical protein [Candidatus Obscuribacterales bacterium]